MTLIYSKKQTHIYIYTSANNPKYSQGSGGGGIASFQLIPFHFAAKHYVWNHV